MTYKWIVVFGNDFTYGCGKDYQEAIKALKGAGGSVSYKNVNAIAILESELPFEALEENDPRRDETAWVSVTSYGSLSMRNCELIANI